MALMKKGDKVYVVENGLWGGSAATVVCKTVAEDQKNGEERVKIASVETVQPNATATDAILEQIEWIEESILKLVDDLGEKNEKLKAAQKLLKRYQDEERFR